MRGGVEFQGIRTYGHGVTYKADIDLKTAAESDRQSVIGKAVTLVDDSTVGFGTEGDPLLGVIKQYEYDGHVSVDDVGYVLVPVNEGDPPQEGDVVAVDGEGGIIKAVTKVEIEVDVESTVEVEIPQLYGPRVVKIEEDIATVRIA